MTNKKLKWFLSNLDINLCVFALAVMMVVASMQIFCRYVLNNSLMWTEELCRFLLIWVSFLSVSCATKYDSHLYVDVIPAALKRNRVSAMILRWVRAAAWIGFSVFLGYMGWSTFTRVVEYSQALYIQLKWIYLAIPVGMWTMAVRVLVGTIKESLPAKSAPEQGDDRKETNNP